MMAGSPGYRRRMAMILAVVSVVLAIGVAAPPASASWLPRVIGGVGIVYSVHKNLGESAGRLGDMLDAYMQGGIEKVRAISEEFDRLPGKIVRDAFPVLTVGLRAVDAAGAARERLRQGLNSAERKIGRFVGGVVNEAGRVVADARAALMIDPDERQLYEHGIGILDDTPLTVPAILPYTPDDEQRPTGEDIGSGHDPWSDDDVGGRDGDPRPGQRRVGRDRAARDADLWGEAVGGSQASAGQAAGSAVTLSAWEEDDEWRARAGLAINRDMIERPDAGCDGSRSPRGLWDVWDEIRCDERAFGGTPSDGSGSYEAALADHLEDGAAGSVEGYEAALAALEREGEETERAVPEEAEAAVRHRQAGATESTAGSSRRAPTGTSRASEAGACPTAPYAQIEKIGFCPTVRELNSLDCTATTFSNLGSCVLYAKGYDQCHQYIQRKCETTCRMVRAMYLLGHSDGYYGGSPGDPNRPPAC